jgi:very-short-patch-repair endonuclease
MWLLLDEPWTMGRRGVAAVREALRDRTDTRNSPQIDLADALLRMLRRERLPIPFAEFPVELPSGLIHVDLAYPLLKIAIECDGYAWHMDRASFERDRARDAELIALGWKVLRFTWAQITYRSEWGLQQVRGRLGS